MTANVRQCRSSLEAKSFFFQAEDGIRDVAVTGVQTCALPISRDAARHHEHRSIVGVGILVEADAPLVGDAHGPREIDDLVQEVPVGRRLEASPLREGEAHVAILTKSSTTVGNRSSPAASTMSTVTHA